MRESRFTSIDRRRFLAAMLVGSSGMSWSGSTRSGGAPHADPPTSASARAPDTDAHVRAIRDALTPQIIQAQARFKIPALSLALVNTDRVLWAEGYGLADVEAGIAATAATRYRAGSLAKPLTAVAVMQLVESGRIDLDQPLSAYLEGFSVRTRVESPKASVSARNLLCHHSGLPTDLTKGMWTDEPFTRVVESLREEYAAFPPELVFSYSNLGYSLLGHLVAVVSGQPFERYMNTHVLGPLGMTDTRFLARPSPASARGYREGAPIALLPVRDLPAHGIETSAVDLSRLMCALLGGGALEGHQILAPSTVEAMSEVQNPDNLLDMEIFNGLGWFLEQDTIPSCGRVLRHGATTPGFAGECILLPEEGLGIAVLANADGARSVIKRLAEETLSRVLSAALFPGEHRAGPDLTPPRCDLAGSCILWAENRRRRPESISRSGFRFRLNGRIRLARHGSTRADSEQVPHTFPGLQGHGSPVGAAVEEESGRGSAVEVDGAIDPPRRQGVRGGKDCTELGEGETAHGRTDDPVSAPIRGDEGAAPRIGGGQAPHRACVFHEIGSGLQ